MEYLKTLEYYQHLLNEEVLFLKKTGGKKYRIFSGEMIRCEDNIYYYQFEVDNEISLSEGMPIQILIKGNYYKANIINVEQFKVNFACNCSLGNDIDGGYLICDPWYLLEALIDRLEECKLGNKYGLSKILVEKGPGLENQNNFVPEKEHLNEMIEKNKITFIWGPPGTGKTTTLANLSINFAKKGKKVLIVSQSNISVDEAILKICQLCNENELLINGKFMRYGYVKNKKLEDNYYCNSYKYVIEKYPNLEKRLSAIDKEISKLGKKDILEDIKKLQNEKMEINKTIKNEQEKVINEAKVIATTISKATIEPMFYEQQFDIVIFDEASMAYIPQIIYASSLAKEKFICIGDLKQLSPIVQGENSQELKKDIYNFLGMEKEDGTISHEWLVILNEQFRSHSKISKFVNKRFYSGRINDTKLENKVKEINDIVESEPFKNHPIIMLNTDGFYASSCKTNDYSRFNIVNASIAITTAIEINKKYKKSVGIITPYAAQARLLRKMLNDYKGKRKNFDIDCSTIHQFQGSERDVIIFDTVENYPTSKLGKLTSSNENKSLDRLVNVAVTRAKGKLIVIGNASYWNTNASSSNSLRSLFRYIVKEDGLVINNIDLKRYIEKKISGKIHYYDNEEESIYDFIEDMELAKEKILIMLPYGENVDPLCIDSIVAINNKNKKLIDEGKEPIDLIIKVPDKKDELNRIKDLLEISRNDCWPITIIDDEILWYGMPDMNKYYDVKGERIREQNKLTIRILGKSTSNLVYQFIDIDNDFVLEDGISYKNLLKEYIEKNIVCPECGQPLTLRKGRKLYIGCQDCDYTHYLEKDIVNSFLDEHKIVCPKDQGQLKMVVTGYNTYLSCSEGHNINIDEFFK